jgi:Cullin protein neddylation domain
MIAVVQLPIINLWYVLQHLYALQINIVDHSRQVPKAESIPPMELISDRKTSVQATICRVMKTRRELCHKDLCEEVKQQLEHLFIPDIAFIKKVCVHWQHMLA